MREHRICKYQKLDFLTTLNIDERQKKSKHVYSHTHHCKYITLIAPLLIRILINSVYIFFY